MCAKGKAWERLTGAEVVALAAVSSVRCPSRGHIVCTPQLLLPIRLSIQKCYSLHSGPDSATQIKICPLSTNGKHLKRWAFSFLPLPSSLTHVDEHRDRWGRGGVGKLSVVKRPQEIIYTNVPHILFNTETEKCGRQVQVDRSWLMT